MRKLATTNKSKGRCKRRRYDEEFRREAVPMMLDGLSASSVAQRWGLSGANLLYLWKQQQLEQYGPVDTSLEARFRELEVELQRVQRELNISKRALAIFPRHE